MPSPIPPKQADEPTATFLVCGHQCPPTARPVLSNDGVKFNESAALFSEPAMCLTCSITHAKNRQQTIVDTFQSKLDAKYEELIDRAVKVSHERDRNEILEKGKQAALQDLLPARNLEIAQVWQEFAKMWSSAERVVATATAPAPPPSKNGLNRSRKQTRNTPIRAQGPPPAASTETLSIRTDKSNGHIAVILTWRDKAGVAVEKDEVMSL
jgi:vacuolar-type H+-ATPase subunit H